MSGKVRLLEMNKQETHVSSVTVVFNHQVEKYDRYRASIGRQILNKYAKLMGNIVYVC